MVKGRKSSWRSVTGCASLESELASIQFNLFINDLDDRTECTLGKFAEGLFDTPDGCAAIQKNIDSLEKWANKNLIKYKKGICQVLYLGTNNPMHWYTLQVDQLERSFAEKELWVLVDKKLNLSQQCAFEARKDNSLSRATPGTALHQLQVKSVILPHSSALGRPHLECLLLSWTLQYRGTRAYWSELSKGP